MATDSKGFVERLVSRVGELARSLGRRVKVMEVCGTHTVAAFRGGLRGLLPDGVELISGPGCPVCVTAQEEVDLSIAFSRLGDLVVCTYGDMLKVPGSGGISLALARARGADVRVVGSTEEVLRMALREGKRFVFLGVGFETTAPATAWLAKEALKLGLSNLFICSLHKRVVPALEALLADPDLAIDGFILPGHVSVVLGLKAYRRLMEIKPVPMCVAGFDVPQMLSAIAVILRDLVRGSPSLSSVYRRAVGEEGNGLAQALLEEVFEPCDAPWRGFGRLPLSGLCLKGPYERLRAEPLLGDAVLGAGEEPMEGCLCGEVLKGKVRPTDCPLFGRACHPSSPVGPCMVSSEGSCAAHYRFGDGMGRWGVRA